MNKLNKIERIKQKLLPIDFDISNIDFHNLNEEDRFYLKNFGIYNIKLRPNTFMLRIRLDSQDLNKKSFLKLLEFVKDNNLKLLTTARGGLELHNIKPENILTIYQKVTLLGFETKQSLTDNVRAIVTDACDGFDTPIKAQDIIKDIKEELINNPKYFGTIPRKFNTAIVTVKEPMANFWSNDLLFALAKKDGEYGFNIYIGGKNNQVAQDANIFIKENDVVKFFFTILNIFNKYGLRESRSKNRFYFLIKEIGIFKIRELIEQKFANKLESRGELLVKNFKVFANKEFSNGLILSRINCNFGETNIEKAIELLNSLKGNDVLRVGVDGDLYIFSKNKFKANSLALQLCAGERYCPLSLWDIKKDTKLLPLNILEENGISVGFSGCLKGCARHMHSDIGLVGLRTNLYGKTEKALRVFIGGYGGEGAQVARLLYYSVPERCFRKLLDVIIKDFLASKAKNFKNYTKKVLNRFDIEFLQLFYLIKYLGLCKIPLIKMNGDEFKDCSSEDIAELAHRAWNLK